MKNNDLFSAVIFFAIFLFFGPAFALAGGQYVEKVLFSMPVSQYVPPTDFCADLKDNFYLLYQDKNVIEVFDPTGKQVRTIPLKFPAPSGQYRILASENGDLLLFPLVDSPFQIFDPSGRVIATGTMHLGGDYNKIQFSKGVIFSDEDGTVYYPQTPEAAASIRKVFINHYQVIRDPKTHRIAAIQPADVENAKSLPVSFGDYHFSDVLAVDDDGDLYVLYETPPQGYDYHHYDSTKYYPTYYRTYIFDKHFNQEGELDFWATDFDEKNDVVYSLGLNGHGGIDFAKWRKSN